MYEGIACSYNNKCNEKCDCGIINTHDCVAVIL